MPTFPDFEQHDGLSLAELKAKGAVSPREVLAAAVERIELLNPQLNAVIHKLYDRAEARVHAGLPEGPFGGVPFLLKDLHAAYQGAPFTEGSRSLRHYVPDYTSTIVRRQEAAGLVVLGKTNTPEFGGAPVTEPELHGITRNPWDLSRTSGGSSGGSAAAVAAGMVPLAHATDGGGSIRIPASHCGLFGLKPTRARTPVGPRLGEAWWGFSAQHAVTRSVRDSAALLDATHGPEPGDPYAAPPPERPYLEELGRPPEPLRVGLYPGALFPGELHPECRRAVEETGRLLEEMGHRVEEVAPPVEAERWTEAFLTMAAADAAFAVRHTAELAGKAKPDPDDYELPTWILSLVGTKLSAGKVAEAMHEVRRAGRVMGELFETLDVLVTSTVARPPDPHGALRPTDTERKLLEGLKRFPARPALLFTFRQLARRVLEPIPNTPLFNLTGQPAMSVPLHWTPEGLPVGVQFAARFGDEATLFRLAARLEEARPWFHRRPRFSV